MRTTLDLPTPQGPCRTTLVTPSNGNGPWPGVILFVDGAGARDVMDDMAARIADLGYVVAVPDVFHRAGPIVYVMPPEVPREPKSMFKLFGNPQFRELWRERFYKSATDAENLRTDVGAVLTAFASRADVKQGPIGVTGYCMGGNIALRIAGMFGDRVAAAASFHGGGLATPAPDSPHLVAPQMKAEVYAACAIEDASCTDEMKALLIDSLKQAGVVNVVETWPGARHGFCVPDAPTFDAASAERHYGVLQSLFARRLSA
jgi:carboxymethylenebutenolidase